MRNAPVQREASAAIRALIIDSDRKAAERIVAALDAHPVSRFEFQIALSLAEVAHANVESFDMAISAMALVDGTGIDALVFIHNAAPGVPVIIIAQAPDAALAREAIRAGAIDCLSRDQTFLERLPMTVECALARCEQMTETQRLQRRLNDSLVDLIDEVSGLQRMIAQLEALAATDDLTGLHNRRRLNTAIDESWQNAQASSAPLACLMIDLDAFKAVNDRLGHQQGDALLRMIGGVLRAHTRESDIVARYGGDEFCVLMRGVPAKDAIAAARRIAAAYALEARAMLGKDWPLGLSIGVAHTELSAPAHALEIVCHADEAMYAAKRHGNCVMIRSRSGVEQAPNPGPKRVS